MQSAESNKIELQRGVERPPVLIVRYVLLAHKEERAMLAQFPGEYARYIEGRPRFIPKLSDILNLGSPRDGQAARH